MKNLLNTLANFFIVSAWLMFIGFVLIILWPISLYILIGIGVGRLVSL